MPSQSKLALAAILLSGAATAQSPAAFEAASVKLLPPPVSGRVTTGGGPGTSDPGRLIRLNVPLAGILAEAFQIQGRLISGPDWLASERYEIIATVPPRATSEDVPRMLQALLADRFGLKFHREPREMPAYALTAGKSGAKLTVSTVPPSAIAGRDGFPSLPDGIPPGAIKLDSMGLERRFAAGAMPLAKFADYLAAQIDLPVVDVAGLAGKYDIVLYYSRPAQAGAQPAATSPDLVSAVREQLGLDLESRKLPVEQLIIDHIEKTPTPN